MSTEVFTPRSFSVSARDVSSTYSYSSSEASSRLAARLERSEYKRSRGKQRLNYYNSSRNQSKRREIKGGRRKHHPASATTRTESEEDGVTSIWEVHRQKPYYYTDRSHSLPVSKVSQREHPKSWYGIPNVNPENKHTRPRSTHDTPSDGRNISPISNQLRLFGKPEERLNSTEPNFSSFLSYQENFQQKHTVHREISHDNEEKYSDIHSYPDKETPCSEANQYHAGRNRSVNKKGMYLSRSLSSSFSSQVGSSDEKEDSQGIYSAYDVASRSPFESMVSQRYSQSSLSSSNASWPHSSSSLNYNVRDIPPLLDPPLERQHNRSDTEHQRSLTANHYDSHFRDNFSIIKENPQKIPPPVPPKPTKYSSSYSIHLHSAISGTKKDPIHQNLFSEKMGLSPPKGPTHQYQQPSQIKDYFKDPMNCLPISKLESNKSDGKGPSVREIAKKFTPCSVRHISSEIVKTHSEDDAHRVKVDSWPKVMSVIPQESSLTFETAAVEDVPPARPPYPNDKIYNFKSVTMRQKDEKCRNAEEIASHRLSLQELIKLHEEQIAIQAKSAKTIFVHAYFKRSPSDVEAGQTKFDFSKELKTYAQLETVSPVTVINKQPSVDNSYKTPKSQMARQDHPGYEVREVDVSHNSPFKVIEITDKATGSTKERTSRLKRHRTIGIVGYRHQIDRTSGEKVPTKQKRHTTVGIVCDFKDATQSESRDEVHVSPGLVSHEDERVPPNETFGQETELIAIPVDKEWREEPRKHIPVKVFETRQELQEQIPAERSEKLKEVFQVEKEDGKVEEEVVSLNTDYLCSSFPGKDLPEENYVPALGFSPDQGDRFDTSSPMIEHPQSSAHSPSPNHEVLTSTLIDTPTRNTHSPVVELLPNRRGNATTAFYKTVSYSTPTTEKTSTCTSDRKQKLPFDERVFYQTKPYAIPVAQVSPVSQDLETQEIIQAQPVEITSSPPPPPEPPSALEMYETRLAMWNLLPSQERATRDETEHCATENQLHSQSKDRCIVRSPPVHQDTTTKAFNNVRGSKFSSNLHSPLKTQEYYLGVIGRLNEENCRLKEKSEAEKREFHRMYQEQKKVANAYQKLEDRYRRRVHELQDALANCTCQGSLINEKSTKSMHVTNSRSDRESQSSKTQSSKGGMRMFEELEEWLTEQSHNTKTAKVNATSRDSLISSSSDLTGTGWDDHCDMRDVNIDQVNGTHV